MNKTPESAEYTEYVFLKDLPPEQLLRILEKTFEKSIVQGWTSINGSLQLLPVSTEISSKRKHFSLVIKSLQNILAYPERSVALTGKFDADDQIIPTIDLEKSL